MNTYATVLQWLNHFNSSQLSAPVAALISQCTPELDDAQVDELLYEVLSSTKKNQAPLEHAEALVCCSQIKFERGNFEEVLRLLNGALPIYTGQKEYHRLAIAKWLLGMVLCQTEDTVHAFRNWYESREIIRAFSERYATLSMPVYMNWYAERLFEMDVCLACTFEDPYTWLDHFEPSRLSPAANRINQLIKQNLHSNPQKTEELLQNFLQIGERSSDFMEQAEVFVECGRAYFYLKKYKQAEKLMQRASALFPPGQHHQAIALWLCGFIQWKIDGQKNRAIQNWQKSSAILDMLARDADHKNFQGKSLWYHEKEKVTARALQLTISQNFS